MCMCHCHASGEAAVRNSSSDDFTASVCASKAACRKDRGAKSGFYAVNELCDRVDFVRDVKWQ